MRWSQCFRLVPGSETLRPPSLFENPLAVKRLLLLAADQSIRWPVSFNCDSLTPHSYLSPFLHVPSFSLSSKDLPHSTAYFEVHCLHSIKYSTASASSPSCIFLTIESTRYLIVDWRNPTFLIVLPILSYTLGECWIENLRPSPARLLLTWVPSFPPCPDQACNTLCLS